MGHVRVITDSACDLPKELIEEHGIEVVPLTIRFGTEEFTDGVDLSTAEFWKRCAGSARLPETAATAPGAFQAAYERAIADGCDGIAVVTISSELSGTYQAATVGADAVADRIAIRVVDSRTVTAAQGLLALLAAEDAAAGKTPDEIAAHVEEASTRSNLIGTLDTLDHLVKGGRVSGAKAMMGSLLSVKPLLVVRDGKVVEDGRQRTRSRALEHVAQRAEKAGPFERIAVGGGDADDLDVVATRLTAVDTTHPLIVTEIGPVVGTHGGPGVVGVCWIARS